MEEKRLNQWVYFARFYSGCLNAGMMLSIETMLTLHTGNLTRIGVSIVQGNWHAIVRPIVAILSYLCGVFLSSTYYADEAKQMSRNYWKGYALIAFLFIVLWILPTGGWTFIIIMSASMGIFCAMPLPNRGYTGTITIMTGLITEISSLLSQVMRVNSAEDKAQLRYLSLNVLAYLLGVMWQTALYLIMDIVRAWTLLVPAAFLAFWAYRYGKTPQTA